MYHDYDFQFFGSQCVVRNPDTLEEIDSFKVTPFELKAAYIKTRPGAEYIQVALGMKSPPWHHGDMEMHTAIAVRDHGFISALQNDQLKFALEMVLLERFQ